MESLKFIKRHLLSIIFACVTVYIMILIFSFSAQTGEISSGVSKGVSRAIAKLIVGGFSELSEAEKLLKIEALVPIVRKTAHFLVYCSLGFFSLITAKTFFRESRRAFKAKKGLIGVSAFCFLYAASDEIHQLFVAERSGSPLDVLLDFCGALVGIFIGLLVYTIFVKVFLKKSRNAEIYQK